MTGPGGDAAADVEFGEFLRRALGAAAESVEPAADGLDRIRARLWPGWRPRTWQVARSGPVGMVGRPAAAAASER